VHDPPRPLNVRPYRESSDRAWAEASILDAYGGPRQARRGDVIDVLGLEGFVAEQEGTPLGILTYRRDGTACEIAFVAALARHAGIGSALLRALLARVTDCERVWVVTTNDNLDALRFYQRRGFVLTALRPGAVDQSRRDLKPQIGTVGDYGIPLRDELELELRLPAGGGSSQDL
jgi:ribosomal protein S18 acetylase RimI-like enzyme